jgi:T-box
MTNVFSSLLQVVLTSMHKYQPRIHIVRTSDPSQIPWSPQKSFAFNETEFVAVTAYQVTTNLFQKTFHNSPFFLKMIFDGSRIIETKSLKEIEDYHG